MSEKRSSVESQKAPKRETVFVMCATLPSQEMVTPERPGRADVDQNPDEREKVGMNAESHAAADDGAQREHADSADEAGNGH
jgi:hypothetical protein